MTLHYKPILYKKTLGTGDYHISNEHKSHIVRLVYVSSIKHTSTQYTLSYVHVSLIHQKIFVKVNFFHLNICWYLSKNH